MAQRKEEEQRGAARGLCAAAVISHAAPLDHPVATKHTCIHVLYAGVKELIHAWSQGFLHNDSLSVIVTDELVGIRVGRLFLSPC